MVRKTKAAAAVTREQILDAAEKVFRERGTTRTSLAAVAAAAGVTRGAVYWHFRDKAELFTAMCDRATLPLDMMVDHASCAAHAEPMATLRRLLVEGLRHLATDPRARAVFEVIFHKSELVGELAGTVAHADRTRRECLTQIEGILRRAIGVGELPVATDPTLAAHYLNAFMIGTMHQWVLDPAAFDLAELAPALADAVLAGLQAQPLRPSVRRPPVATVVKRTAAPRRTAVPRQ